MNWEKEEISSILKELNTSSTGLTTKEAENRIQIYGKNALEEKDLINSRIKQIEELIDWVEIIDSDKSGVGK